MRGPPPSASEWERERESMKKRLSLLRKMRLEPFSTKRNIVLHTLITDPKARRAAWRGNEQQPNKTHDTPGGKAKRIIRKWLCEGDMPAILAPLRLRQEDYCEFTTSLTTK